MSLFHNSQILPPANWQEFETLCCDLWRRIWNDPNTQKNGRQSQPQHGVDVYGRPNQGDNWAGVQCKGKNDYRSKPLTEKDVRAEVEKAKSFDPKLSQFIIATTEPNDEGIQELARKITEEHRKNNLFSVDVLSWTWIIENLGYFPELIEEHYPGLGPNTKATRKGIDNLQETTQKILEQGTDLKSGFTSLSEKIDATNRVNYAEVSMTALTPEYHAELDHSTDLLNKYNPWQALKFLEKLKRRIWSSAQPIVKYRVLTNMGSAKLNLNKTEDAAKLFIEALQYNPKDEKSLCNVALGYVLLGQHEEAKTFADKVLTKNPASSRAYSIIIQTSSDDERLEDIIAKVPEPHRTTPEIAYAISYLFRQRDNLYESKKWLETAIENDKEDTPDLKEALGEILIDLAINDQSTISGIQLNDAHKEQIQKSIELLTSAWNRIADTDIKKLKLSWIVNRGIAKRLLGNMEDAIKDVEFALDIEPSNSLFIKHRALLSHKIGDNEKAIALLKRILSAKETPEAALLLAGILLEKSEFSEDISTITELLRSNPPEPLEEANRLLIQLYIATQDFENARKISDSMRDSDPTNILYLVDAARISRFSGEITLAISRLNEAKKYITNTASYRQLLELADEFYSTEQFEDAANVYEKIIDKTLDTPLTHKLLNSYYRAGETGKSLEICKILRQNYGPLKYVSEMESTIYEETGNLPEAKKVCQEYISSFSDDFGMKLRLAVVNFRSKNFNELDDFLNSSIDISTLPLEYGIQLVHLYVARSMVQKSFEIMYEIRRNFFGNGDVHLEYIIFFFQREKDACQWLKVNNVCIDTAVRIEDELGKREWYIIEKRKDADISRREIKSEHKLSKKLIGKSVGDKIILEENDFSREIVKIIEIKSKYVYALHESMSSFKKLFPGKQGFWPIKLGPPEKEGNLPEGFQKIWDKISRQQIKVEQFYKEGKLTVGAFANLIGQNVLDVWNVMTNKPDLGVKCCRGNIEERTPAISLLNDKPKLILDIISLMTLHGINAENIIIKSFKLGIAQSTIDIFQYIINERKGSISKGFMTIGKVGDKFVKQEISAEEVKHNVEYLESILHWIENNCEIIPCNAALDMKRDRKQQLDEMFGSSFIDSILIASEPGNLLYSDDERLRSFAKGEFNVDGTWTQVVLMYCLNINILEKAKYNEMIVKLACFHYYHTSIDADVLIEAARQSNWLPSTSYITLLKILSGKSSDENSALIVATNFLYELWRQPILPMDRDCLILYLLSSIMDGRKGQETIDKLIFNVNWKFCSLRVAKRQILSLINLWKQINA